MRTVKPIPPAPKRMSRPFEKSGALWVPSRREMLGVLGAGLLAPRIARAAAFSLVAHTGGALGLNPPKVTSAIDTTGANLLVAVLVSSNGSGAYVSADSKSNTWTALTARTQASGSQVQMYYCVPSPAQVGSGHTVTFQALMGFYASGYFAAFSGSAAAPFDIQNGATNTSAAMSPGSITPAFSDELVISGISMHLSSAPTVDASMTVLDSNGFLSGNYFGGGIAYKIQTTAAAINPVWTMSSSDKTACVIASFKSTSSAIGSSRVRHKATGGE
jgi:hypothetical protein